MDTLEVAREVSTTKSVLHSTQSQPSGRTVTIGLQATSKYTPQSCSHNNFSEIVLKREMSIGMMAIQNIGSNGFIFHTTLSCTLSV